MLKHRFVFFLFSIFSLAQAIESYFPLSGTRSSKEQIEANMAAVRQLEFDPTTWPEVTFERKQQSLLPLMKKTPYWNIQLPVYDHTEKKMKPFGFKFFPSPNYSAESTRLIVIYPTIEGETVVEGNLTRMALNEGHHVLIAPIFEFDYKSGADGLKDIRDRTLFGVKAVKTFFDFLDYCYRNSNFPNQQATQILKNVRPQEILQIGISNGTVGSYIVSQTDSRVSQQILIVPIGNVPGVFATTKNEKITPFREEQMRFYGLTDPADFAKLAKEVFKFDPLDYVDSFHSPKTLAFFQQEDTTVPGRFQKELLSRINAVVVSRELDIARINHSAAERLNNFLIKTGAIDADSKAQIEQGLNFEHYQNDRVLRAIDYHQKENSLFHELGFGHVNKILSLVFVFNKEIKKFFNLQKKFSPTWHKEDFNFMIRETPLAKPAHNKCSVVVGSRG